MDFSRRTLSLVTVLVILVALGAGVVWRLGGLPGGPGGPATAGLPDDGDSTTVDLLAGSSSQFSADLPQPVIGAEVIRGTLWIHVSASGEAQAFRRATVNAQVEGVVMAVPVRESEAVAAAQQLLQIDTAEYALDLASARVAVLDAEATFRQMVLFDDEITDPQVRVDRERIARARSGLDAGQVQLQRAQMQLARTHVTAPFEGLISDIKVVAGQHVNSGAELMTVVDLDPIKVEVQVLEAELGYLAAGRRAEVRFAAYPKETFTGAIETINPVVDPASRTGRVTVLLPNPSRRIRPGMYAEVSLDAEALPDRVIVPRAAILERGEGRRRTMLFVYDGDPERGLAKWEYVMTGRENETQVEIVPSDEGMVDPGEIVLIDGHHYLAHDTPVRLVESVAAAGGRPGL